MFEMKVTSAKLSSDLFLKLLPDSMQDDYQGKAVKAARELAGQCDQHAGIDSEGTVPLSTRLNPTPPTALLTSFLAH